MGSPFLSDVVPAVSIGTRTQGPAPASQRVTAWLPLALLPVTLLLWIPAVRSIDMAAVTDYGLVSVLPVGAWAALLLLIASFVLWWWRDARRYGWLLALHIVLFIVLFYGIPAVASDSLRGPIVYRHAGITDYLTRTGIVNTRQDAYFNWPGFFMGLGFTVEIGGMRSAMALGRWATVAVELMYLPPLLMLLRALTKDARLLWAAALLFFVMNWVNQDYLAPQSFTYIFYLTILALVLTYLKALDSGFSSDFSVAASTAKQAGADLNRGIRVARWSRRVLRVLAPSPAPMPEGVPSTAVGGGTGALVTLVVMLLFAATVASHQLTPYALFFAVSLLVVTGHCRVRGLPVLMGVLLVAWTIFVASGYIDGHLEKITEGSGVATSTAANLTGRLAGSDAHVLIVWERMALSASIWLLSALGAVSRFRKGHQDHAAALLFLAPIPLFLLPYGGEVLMRLYFFMLPFVAFFAAALFVSNGAEGSASRPRVLAAALSRGRRVLLFGSVVCVLMAGSFIARYGNERMDYFTRDEIAAVAELYRLAPAGSYLLVETNYLPWRYQDYEWNRSDPTSGGHRYLSLSQQWELDPSMSPGEMAAWTADTLRADPAAGKQAGFLLLSRSQRAHEEILGGQSAATMGEYEQYLKTSGEFRLVYVNQDARIYARDPEI